MSSKMTELTKYSPYILLPSVMYASGIFSWLGSLLSIASLGHFDTSEIYDGYKAVEALDPACTECLRKGKEFFKPYDPWSSKHHHLFVGKKPCQGPGAPISNIRLYLWSKKDAPFWTYIPVSEAPTPDSTSGYYNLTSYRQRDVARWTNVGGPIPVGGRPIYSSSMVPISKINSQGVVKKLRRIANSPTNPNAECSDVLDGE
ncbi:hypothetical protein O181_087015 [Austropuccinia psidii MF-1]|uniref:Uncharacterized protein n=1 Tax=Austropuccinia psidii MF-1 TaxID=1389203 RepID=A0A9Q3INX3_9BASI|nr:hypothetical protein [Austropuccinia psidii MF-1]